jgi:hypothetical protein
MFVYVSDCICVICFEKAYGELENFSKATENLLLVVNNQWSSSH